MKQKYELKEGQSLSIAKCAGSLTLRSWDNPYVSIKGMDVSVEPIDDQLVISASSDIKVQVPADIAISINIETVNGNCNIKGVSSRIRFAEINGNFSASRARSVTGEQVGGNVRLIRLSEGGHIDQVNGHLLARQVTSLSAGEVHGGVDVKESQGKIYVDTVYSQLSLKGIDGEVQVDNVMGGADLRRVSGPIHLEQVNGDVELRGGLRQSEHKSVIHSAGNISLRWLAGEPVQLLVTSDGEIVNKLHDVSNFEMESGDQNSLAATIGDGGPTLVLSADGDVMLRTLSSEPREYSYSYDNDENDFSVDLEIEFDELGEKVSSQFEALGKKLEKGFGPDFAANISRKIEAALDQAAAKISRVQRRDWGTAPTPPKPPTPLAAASYDGSTHTQTKEKPDTSAQQLKILEMLERGDISVEDANMLLKALE